MTVQELIELNQMIVDVEIEIRGDRGNGHSLGLIDVLLIGCAVGKTPRCPRKVPESGEAGCMANTKMAHYIDKSINAWDDGKDYWQVKTKRIPQAWLDLNVYSWEVWPASILGNPRRTTGNAKNVNFHGQRINIVALPSGQEMRPETPKQEQIDEQIDGQTNIFDFIQEES